MESKFVNVRKSEDAFIINMIDETGGRTCIPCLEIRGAVVFPDALNRLPGYFLLLGIKNTNFNSLIFLAEKEDADPKTLINTLVAFEPIYRFHAIYTAGFSNITPGVLPDYLLLDLHKSFKQNIPWVRLCPDPYADNIPIGVNLIAQLEHGKGFEPPLRESVLRQHLNSLEIGELPGREFHAVHALRYLLGGLKIHKRLDLHAIESHREEALSKKTRESLSAITRAAWEEVQLLRKRTDTEDEEHWIKIS